MPYDPKDPNNRIALATAIEKTLLAAGFFEEWHGDEQGAGRDPGDFTNERTFARVIDGLEDARIVVYSTIEGYEVRRSGKDAIRILAVMPSNKGRDRPFVSRGRVHRVGDISDICDRMLQRARETWSDATRAPRCPRCSAPMFKSKKGNTVCARLCWVTSGHV